MGSEEAKGFMRSSLAAFLAVATALPSLAFAAPNEQRRQQANEVRGTIESFDRTGVAAAAQTQGSRAFGALVQLFLRDGFDRDDALMFVRLAVDLSEVASTLEFRTHLLALYDDPGARRVFMSLAAACRSREDGFPAGTLPTGDERGKVLKDQTKLTSASGYQVSLDKLVREREVCEVKNMIDEGLERRQRRQRSQGEHSAPQSYEGEPAPARASEPAGLAATAF